MATQSSTLAWEIPQTEEPGRLQSMGSQRDMTKQLNNNNSNYLCQTRASQSTFISRFVPCIIAQESFIFILEGGPRVEGH